MRGRPPTRHRMYITNSTAKTRTARVGTGAAKMRPRTNSQAGPTGDEHRHIADAARAGRHTGVAIMDGQSLVPLLTGKPNPAGD